jgi:glycosyltransferase involved in cell wall biosynthesis
MPVHNGMPYIEESVVSLLEQSFREFELIVGDDASSDGTGEVLRRLAAADPRIRVLRREHKSGLAGAGNWVVKAARAPLVAIAHADDIALPTRLQRQVEVLCRRSDAVMVGAMFDGIDEQGRLVQPANMWRLARPGGFAPFAHSTIMFRRAAFEAVGGYRSKADYWEDLDLYWRMATIGRIFVIPDVLGRYRHSGASARSRDQAERVEDSLDLMYRSAARQRAGVDHDELLRESAKPDRIHPRVFIARSWTRLWTGRSSEALAPMMRRARLGPDLDSMLAIVFVVWATVNPRSLRWVLQIVARGRNRVAMKLIGGARQLEWRPRHWVR